MTNKSNWNWMASRSQKSDAGHFGAARLVFVRISACLILLLVLAGCEMDEMFKTSNAAADLLNEKGLKVLQGLADSDRNILLAPFGLTCCLELAYLAAEGKTREELSRAVGITPEAVDLAGRVRRSWRTNRGVRIHSASALFLDSSVEAERGYLDFVDELGLGDVAAVDFARPGLTHAAINRWAKQKTDGRIDDAAPDCFNKDMAVLMVDVFYFKGLWETPFKESSSEKLPFRAPQGEKMVMTMHSVRDVPYCEEDGIQAIELQYKNPRFSLVAILPPEGEEMRPFVGRLAQRDVRPFVAGMKERLVEIFLPRVSVRTAVQLKDVLRNAGVNDLFDKYRAELTSFRDEQDGNVYVDGIAQKAWLDIDEEGTTAVAVTTAGYMVYTSGGVSPVIFRADRPYLVLIYDKAAKLVLFSAIVNDPQGH